MGSTYKLPPKLLFLNVGEEIGIPSVGVKSVEIRKNTDGEGKSLA